MHCSVCGKKLGLRFCENEGLIPFCDECGEFKFPPFDSAISLIITNREQNKILLAKYLGENDYSLLSGFIKKGESAEKSIAREIKEQTKLNTVKCKYLISKYNENDNALILYFIVVIEDGTITALKDEVDSLTWFDFSNLPIEFENGNNEKVYLTNAITELKKSKI